MHSIYLFIDISKCFFTWWVDISSHPCLHIAWLNGGSSYVFSHIDFREQFMIGSSRIWTVKASSEIWKVWCSPQPDLFTSLHRGEKKRRGEGRPQLWMFGQFHRCFLSWLNGAPLGVWSVEPVSWLNSCLELAVCVYVYILSRDLEFDLLTDPWGECVEWSNYFCLLFS